MSQRRSVPARTTSQAVAKVALVVLVLIAIAGLVLGTNRGRRAANDESDAKDSTAAASSAMTAPALTEEQIRAETEAGPNGLLFAKDSDRISEPAAAKLERIATVARDQKRAVMITGKIDLGGDRGDQTELVKKRTFAVRRALNARGIPLGTITIQIDEMPKALFLPKQANRVDVALR
jgi:outer membrane protein OmpA-like peptidoglycan-associated protein